VSDAAVAPVVVSAVFVDNLAIVAAACVEYAVQATVIAEEIADVKSPPFVAVNVVDSLAAAVFTTRIKATPLTKFERESVVPLFVSEPVSAVNVVVVEDDERTMFSPVPSVAAPAAFDSAKRIIVPFVAAEPVTAPEVTCVQVAVVADVPVEYAVEAVFRAPVMVAVDTPAEAISVAVSYRAFADVPV